ncbi:MAG: Gfo/Idh/MocA family oxidoreductase [Gemmataceae bacterium]
MIRIGIAGIGFMGMIHYLAARQLRDAKIVAICSRDEKKLAGDWTTIQGNYGPRGEMMDLSGIKKYRDLKDMIADPEIDLIDVCNPTNLHPDYAMHALRAGKHVIVEKAIALSAKEADAMLATSREAKRLLMVAHVLPFIPEFAFAAEVVKSKKYGNLVGAHFRRVISQPDWSADIGDASKTGGPAVDLHIHDTHFIGLLCGVPGHVMSTGVVRNGAVDYLTTQYLYGPGGPAVTCSSGAVAMKARPFVHGFEIYLEKATLTFESGVLPLTVLHADGTTETPKFEGADDATAAFTNELQAAVDGVKAGKEPDLLSAKLARDALVLCWKEIESVKTGKAVAID